MTQDHKTVARWAMRSVAVCWCWFVSWLCGSGSGPTKAADEAHKPILGTASEQAENGADNYGRNRDRHDSATEALNERF